ncbi:DUF3604 domain-containing protein [Pseudomaricurvus alkylphenolicus]|uniref:DUF3604 domain-containing protein n=1 Tax=Pseudomaricurvus alkylphenolicus TaxID=1306991 RepID=UPI00141E65D1|nr:DUF3604 domain-containing protein [Pseudomaricurvus alkylphenolicus]NIB38608.1 DUF3604 domain-containing protein [Pseudomaricurvus alkylphenolicus]
MTSKKTGGYPWWKIGGWIGLVLIVLLVAVYFSWVRIPDPQGYYQQDPLDAGEPVAVVTPVEEITDRRQRQMDADTLHAETGKQILFGDTHVHTTWSLDAFMFSLPIMNGSKGAYPPAAACDYARYVSQLDFFFLTDHAESYTPQRWRDAQEAVRLCNTLSGDPANPDLVAFIGFEWSQIGNNPDEHFGHHNILYRDVDASRLPTRPIGAAGLGTRGLRSSAGAKGMVGALKWLDGGNQTYYQGLSRYLQELKDIPDCALDVPSPRLPDLCYETAATTGELYQKLDQWGFDTLVVPHGSSWGIYTPPGASWEHQLTAEHYDADKGRLIEVYSGHGSSEVYRDYRARDWDQQGNLFCPPPQENYLPSCWQAGEIIKNRCLLAGESDAQCQTRAELAREHYLEVENTSGWLSVPGTSVEEWLDAGQARDVFLPAFNYVAKKSAQYGLALTNFDDPENPLRFTWGFIGSSDTHFARPGNGFKQFPRIGTSDAGMRGGKTPFWQWLIYGRGKEAPEPHSRSLLKLEGYSGDSVSEQERKMSFLTAGGVVAVHAEGRDRSAIWDALKRREVYGTSGHRLLLWFDLVNAGDDSLPMGSQVSMAKNPRFRVTAVGSLKQLPGCPDYVLQNLEAKKLQKLAQGECYNPGDERYRVDRIEVIRIRPQAYAGEAVQKLVEDTWKVFPCDSNSSTCSVEFSDDDFLSADRDAVYYVRAIEEPSPTVNGDNLRASRNSQGQVDKINPCFGDHRTPRDDDCTTMKGQRAWSSPIFVNISRKGPPS